MTTFPLALYISKIQSGGNHGWDSPVQKKVANLLQPAGATLIFSDNPGSNEHLQAFMGSFRGEKQPYPFSHT